MHVFFANVDENGEIIDALFGPAVIPDRPFDFFFFVESEVAENFTDYKVEIINYKPELVLK